MTATLRLLPRALALFPLFVICWLLLTIGGVVWCVLELTEPEGEGWEEYRG